MAWNGVKHSDCEGKITHVDAKVMGQVTLGEADFQNPILGFAQVFAFVSVFHGRRCLFLWYCGIRALQAHLEHISTRGREALGLSARPSIKYITIDATRSLSRRGGTQIKKGSRKRCRS